MGKMINLKIDDRPVTVPEGMLIVDAAKKLDIDIPVFCYHPKMKPVGMCRMCLVEIGMPARDRQSGEIIVDEEGNPKVDFRGLGCSVGRTFQSAGSFRDHRTMDRHWITNGILGQRHELHRLDRSGRGVVQEEILAASADQRGWCLPCGTVQSQRSASGRIASDRR